jgi:hypothetical protein
MKVDWIDGKREPQHPPHPSYPNGIDLDCSFGAKRTCTQALPYPAKRCGYFEVECEVCGAKIAISTAGRVDDPRSIKIACKLEGSA